MGKGHNGARAATNGSARGEPRADIALDAQLVSMTVGEVMNLVPVVNYLLVVKPNGRPTSLLFGMLVAEVAAALEPHVSAFNAALKKFNQDLGVTAESRRFAETYGVEFGAGMPSNLDAETRRQFFADTHRIEPLVAQLEEEERELRAVRVEVRTPRLAVATLEREGVELTGQQLHALRCLLVLDAAESVG